MNSKIYLLTGATGLLGGNILKQLIARNEQVRVLVLSNDPAKNNIPDGVEIVEGGLLDDASLDKFFTVSENTELVVIYWQFIFQVFQKTRLVQPFYYL